MAEYKGAPFAEGTAYSRDWASPADSELVARHKRAGLIILGKTNTPELGIMPTTEPRRFGATRNPWNIERHTGGSSGGSAAAVAARMVPMAHGNDGGGSIRIPASICGIFGLKPTRGRNSLAPNYGDFMSGLVAEHGLTISVRDSAALLDATCGPAVGEPYYAPPPKRPYLKEVGADPGKLRIGLSDRCDRRAGERGMCQRRLGYCETLEKARPSSLRDEIEVDGEAVTRAFVAVWFSSFAWEVEMMSRKYGRAPTAEEFEPLTWAIKEAGKNFSAVDYICGVQDLQRISRASPRCTKITTCC